MRTNAPHGTGVHWDELMRHEDDDYDDFEAVKRLHPHLGQRVIDADRAIQGAEDDDQG